ncbi:unnamed protein product [Schistocephalus solidus]|uniref:Uncharacterized protein n=1 Tax=Schistocephalus solidus TaxID=70667 RepID=A0A183TR19_SCHSO|nr:unnamed protein product [Schistocephalus solidus]
MLRQVQLRWSGHLVRTDDEQLPKRLFYGDVATGACRQGGQKRRCKDTSKNLSQQAKLIRQALAAMTVWSSAVEGDRK